MLEKSKNHNENYLAKIVKLNGLRKHTNADRLQCVNIDFQNVITGIDAKDGDICVFFPLECKINPMFLKHTNSFAKAELNADTSKKGFFSEKGRVRAVKLREEKSMGYLVPINELESFLGLNKGSLTKYVNEEFDTIQGALLCEKYVPKHLPKNSIKTNKGKQGQTARISKIIEGQQHFHISTSNLRKNIHNIKLDDLISITYKTHGTSVWAGNVLVKKQLTSLKDRIAKWLGVLVEDKEYGVLYGSRKVVKNEYFNDPKNHQHFYSEDIWDIATKPFRNDLPKGYTVYGEILGYTPQGSAIQGLYDYGCNPGEHKLEVYRVTNTNPDGLVTELTYPQMVEFCKRLNLTPSHLFFYGTVAEWMAINGISYHIDDYQSTLLLSLEKVYNEKNCFMCNNSVPEEGIVLRKESLFSCDSYKLKSYKFLEYETIQLDKEVVDIESEN